MPNEPPTTSFINITSAKCENIEDCLDFLGLPFQTPALYLILRDISYLLKKGIAIKFVPESDHLDNNEISKAWRNWSEIFATELELFERRNRKSTYEKQVFDPKRSTGSKTVDWLLRNDPAKPDENNSSNLEGTKLLLIAYVLKTSSGKITVRDKEVELKEIFEKSLNIEAYYETPLNFSRATSIDEISSFCEKQIEDHYRRKSRNRTFLDTIRAVCLTIDGYILLPEKKKDKPNTTKGKRGKQKKNRLPPKNVFIQPYFSPGDFEFEPDFGDLFSIPGSEDEEPIVGILSPLDDDSWKNKDSETFQNTIIQEKSKYWLSNFNQSLPWNQKGINPVTRKILVDWIWDNDTDESFLFGLMLSVGKRLDKALELKIGTDFDITPTGFYNRKYIPAEQRFKPNQEQEQFLQKTTTEITLELPTIVKNRFIEKCSNDDTGKSIQEAWNLKDIEIKKECSKVTKKLIKNGANGLAIDRIHLSLGKSIAEITGDDSLGYIVAGSEKDHPPMSIYYTAHSISYIEDIYRKAVRDLYNRNDHYWQQPNFH